MTDLTATALLLFRSQHGHASIGQLDEAGVHRRARHRMTDSGLLVPVYKSVVRIASAPDTLDGRCAAVCLAHPKGFVTGPTGGILVGLRRMPKAEPIHFSVPHGVHLEQSAHVVLHQTTSIGARDVRRRRDGINLASPARLAFDLAAVLGRLDHASVVEQMLRDRMCSMADLAAVARRLCHPRRPGSLRFIRSLMERGERPAADSHPEVVLGEALRNRGVPVVSQLSDLKLPNGRTIRIDLAVPAVRWAVEIDVHPDHLLLEGTARDKRRDRQCHLIGWQVERVSELDLVDLAGIVDELVALYEIRLTAAA